MQLSAQKDVAENSVLLPERFGPVTVLAPSASDSTDVSRVRSDSGLGRAPETEKRSASAAFLSHLPRIRDSYLIKTCTHYNRCISKLQVQTRKISKKLKHSVSGRLFQLQKDRPDAVGAGNEMPVEAVYLAAGSVLARE